MLRILQHGLLDGAGNRFDPSIVRIGVNVHHSVKSVSLESQLEQKLGGNDRVSGLVRHGSPLFTSLWVCCGLDPAILCHVVPAQIWLWWVLHEFWQGHA